VNRESAAAEGVIAVMFVVGAGAETMRTVLCSHPAILAEPPAGHNRNRT
jgi:hypothetical protein